MHQWRNWHTRTSQKRVGNRAGSSPAWCTIKIKKVRKDFLFYIIKEAFIRKKASCLCRNKSQNLP